MLHFCRCTDTHTHLHHIHLDFASAETEQEKVGSSSWQKSTKFKETIYQYICQNVTVNELLLLQTTFFLLSKSCNVINNLIPLKDPTTSCRILLNIPWSNGCCRTIKKKKKSQKDILESERNPKPKKHPPHHKRQKIVKVTIYTRAAEN